MRKFAQILLSCSLALLVVGVFDAPESQARSQYQKAMGKIYPKLLEKHGKKKGDTKKFDCTVCHAGKTKKTRNDYGAALAKALGAKKVKDEDKIKKAFEKIAKEKSTKDAKKTYGELIKDVKLPGTDKVAK